jgi:hypothetical protein
MQVSQNQLSELTGKDRKTIRKLLADMPHTPGPHSAMLYDSKRALEKIYIGDGDAAFVTTAEAFRQLTIAKKDQIDLDMQIKRGERIPLEDAEAVFNEAVMAIAGIIKASKLPVSAVNEIFGQLREAGTRMLAPTGEQLKNGADGFSAGNGSSLPDFGDGAQPPH